MLSEQCLNSTKNNPYQQQYPHNGEADLGIVPIQHFYSITTVAWPGGVQ
jgi:hypothetical protein